MHQGGGRLAEWSHRVINDIKPPVLVHGESVVSRTRLDLCGTIRYNIIADLVEGAGEYVVADVQLIEEGCRGNIFAVPENGDINPTQGLVWEGTVRTRTLSNVVVQNGFAALFFRYRGRRRRPSVAQSSCVRWNDYL